MSLFAPVFAALNESGARYVVVGGLATVLQGYARLTADIDVVVDFEPTALRLLLDRLLAIGLRPRPPVPAQDFADPEKRASWMRDKGMRVFSLWDPSNPLREVDLFVEHPVEFDELYLRSDQVSVAGTEVRIASIPDLIVLKRVAGRAQDIQDIEALQAILERRKDSKE